MTVTTPTEFFYEYAAWGYRPDRETPEEGRRRGAGRLAAAEKWLAEQPHQIRWVPDEDVDRSWLPRRDKRPLFGCVASAMRDDGGWDDTSLWGIDLGETGTECRPYMRVAVAELAMELMPATAVTDS